MKTRLLIRLAILLILIHFLGHLFGHMTWKESDGNAIHQEVIREMTENKFDFMGARRSMGDYYEGYGLLILIKYAMLIALLWIIGNHVAEYSHFCKKLLYPVSAALIVFGVVEFVYFFPFAASMSLGAGILTLISTFSLSGQKGRKVTEISI
jgi:hypothetical protein